MSLPDSSLGPEIGPQHPVARSPSHFAMACQALSHRTLFCQHSTSGKQPSPGCKGIGSLCFIWELHFQELEASSFARPDIAVDLFIGKSAAAERHGQGPFSPAFGKDPKAYGWGPRTVLLGHPPEGCWGEGWGESPALPSQLTLARRQGSWRGV